MGEPIKFEIIESGGVFDHGESMEKAIDALDDILDRYERGRLSRSKFISALHAIIRRHPNFVDGYAHLGYAMIEKGDPNSGLEACLHGLQIGLNALPKDFAGLIEWRYLENRPFLRAAHGVVLCHLRLKQRREAIAMMEKILAWNPRDNQGISLLIGSEYLRNGDVLKAATIMDETAHLFPPYHYEIGLINFMKGAFVAAATHLRRGFLENIYIAEIICGCKDPIPFNIGPEADFSEIELAKEYVDSYGDLWWSTPNAVQFLRWLHTNPKILIERASILEVREALTWECDLSRRRLLMHEEMALRSGIDDRLSNEIVVIRKDRNGRQIARWLYDGRITGHFAGLDTNGPWI